MSSVHLHAPPGPASHRSRTPKPGVFAASLAAFRAAWGRRAPKSAEDSYELLASGYYPNATLGTHMEGSDPNPLEGSGVEPAPIPRF